MGLIYKYTNMITTDAYIGKTISTINERFKGHLSAIDNGSDAHFHRALRKYGIENFNSEVLEDEIKEENINEREIYWIQYYDTFNNGYNMTQGGDGGNTRINFTDEEKKNYYKKISVGNKGRRRSEDMKQNYSKSKLKTPVRNIGKKNGRTKKFIIKRPDGSQLITDEGRKSCC